MHDCKASTVPLSRPHTRHGRGQTFTVYRTHHGPVVRAADGKWISVRLMQEPVKALTQSYSPDQGPEPQAEFQEMMELHTNSSNNTVYADADGNIAYFHANFVPKRDDRSSTGRKPVDGSDPATDWQGIHTLDESPERAESRRSAGSRTPTTGPTRPPAPTARSAATSRRTSTRSARTRAASTRSGC